MDVCVADIALQGGRKDDTLPVQRLVQQAAPTRRPQQNMPPADTAWDDDPIPF